MNHRARLARPWRVALLAGVCALGACGTKNDDGGGGSSGSAGAGPENTLRITLAGNGTGRVKDDGGYMDCPSVRCYSSEGIPAGYLERLTATADLGSTFAGWSQACNGTGICEVTVNGSMNVTATFVR